MTDELVIELEGRKFREITVPTLQHRDWFKDRELEAGIFDSQPRDGESNDEFARRLHRQVTSEDKGRNLVGGLIMPADLQDKEWSPEVAAETTAFVKKLTDPAAIAVVDAIFASLLIAFFQDGLRSYEASRSSSAAAGARVQPASESMRASLAVTATGETSSGDWPAGTMN